MAEKSKKVVSKFVVRRLPRYYRYLGELMDAGITRISSTELGKKMHVTASQIRQDLNCFGGFGQQGYGYSIPVLYKAIGEILGIDKGYKTIIIGAGNLGHALANYNGFKKRGFQLCGIFDINKKIIGTEICGIRVCDIEDIEDEFEKIRPDIAILTVPRSVAADVADKLCQLGIKGIWNFSHMDLSVSDGICVENVHLGDSLMTLSHNITKNLSVKKEI